ncbi:hypothetical protein GCM10009639_48650 [Kitasatospora putterlickiae]|uniref:VWA domain-containing protein n=1 Tax=Kitasatospora putterlickiae TaxID=221725 RepID=A0ABN1YBY6_9ACTN
MYGRRAVRGFARPAPDLRKRANVLLVIDTSPSMDAEVDGTGRSKLQFLKDAAPELIEGFADEDRTGLWMFSFTGALDGRSNHRALVDLGPVRTPAAVAPAAPR